MTDMPGQTGMISTTLTWVIGTEIVGSLVGLILLYLLINLAQQLGGVVGSALRNLIVGVGLFTVAFIVAGVLQALNVTAMENTMLVHMALMILALIMIVLSARTLAQLVH